MRLSRVFPAVAGICLCVSSVQLFAQTHVLREIAFTGAPAYSQAELLAFTGLKPGGSATQQQIEEVAQRLNDTGLFADVNFSGNDKGITYALTPAPASAMRPARFANFVWWQDEEVDRVLKTKVPLYHSDAVPTTGNLRDSIAAALTAMVTDKGLPEASVSSRLGASRAGGPLDRLVFSIDTPPVLIHTLTLAGASAGMEPKLGAVLHDVAGQPWDEVQSYTNISGRVGDVYRNEGYLDIGVADPKHSAPSIGANGVELDVTATLSEGAQYHVVKLDWPGSEFLSTADFNKQAKLKPGDPDSPTALRETLHALTTAYGSKGYIDAKILAPPTIDRTAHQVAYSISVVPGSQYRVSAIHWTGVSDAQANDFETGWSLKPGDVYDNTYPSRFFALKGFFARQGYKFGVMEKRDPRTLTVDLTITLTKGAAASQP